MCSEGSIVCHYFWICYYDVVCNPCLFMRCAVEGMREHLFVFDIENERFRWKESSNCKVYHG